MHPWMFFRMFEIRRQVAQHQSLGTSHDNRQVFYSWMTSKPAGNNHILFGWQFHLIAYYRIPLLVVVLFLWTFLGCQCIHADKICFCLNSCCKFEAVILKLDLSVASTSFSSEDAINWKLSKNLSCPYQMRCIFLNCWQCNWCFLCTVYFLHYEMAVIAFDVVKYHRYFSFAWFYFEF